MLQVTRVDHHIQYLLFQDNITWTMMSILTCHKGFCVRSKVSIGNRSAESSSRYGLLLSLFGFALAFTELYTLTLPKEEMASLSTQ